MPKDVKCRNCNNLMHHWCVKVIDSPDEDLLRDCPYFWQKTHGDQIRAMSDEELADNWMRDFVICHRCAYRYECECDEYVTNEKCKEGIVEWLKQRTEVLGTNY